MASRRLETLVAVLLVLLAGPAGAATFEVAFTSIERAIVAYMMSEGGRFYIQGDPSTPCRYAFLQEPRVDAIGERLRIGFRFSGKAGIELGGKCRGTGDNFDVQVTGLPAFEGGEFFLSDMRLESVESSYFNLVAPLIRSALERRLRISVEDSLKRAAPYLTGPVGTLRFENVSVGEIEVGATSVRMAVSFDAALT